VRKEELTKATRVVCHKGVKEHFPGKNKKRTSLFRENWAGGRKKGWSTGEGIKNDSTRRKGNSEMVLNIGSQ